MINVNYKINYKEEISMYKLGDITMYSPDDVCKAFHIGKSKCLRIFKMRELHAVRMGRKLLVS